MSDEPGSGRSVRVSPQLVIAGVLGAGLAAFVFQNTRKVRVDWLFLEATAPLWLVLLITVAAALIAGELVGAAIRRSRRKRG